MVTLGHVGLLLQREDEAIALDEDTYQRRRNLLGGDDPDTLISPLSLSGLLRRSGREGEAIQLCAEALSRCHEVLGQDHYTTLDATARMAVMLHSDGSSKDALTMREEVLPAKVRSRVRITLSPYAPHEMWLKACVL